MGEDVSSTHEGEHIASPLAPHSKTLDATLSSQAASCQPPWSALGGGTGSFGTSEMPVKLRELVVRDR